MYFYLITRIRELGGMVPSNQELAVNPINSRHHANKSRQAPSLETRHRKLGGYVQLVVHAVCAEGFSGDKSDDGKTG